MSSALNNLPQEDEVELHVFGPGYGECMLVHTGRGQWVVVDSCRQGRAAPAALGWLSTLGVDPAKAVSHVIATHWHDDHIRGMGETFAACANATFICSTALLSEELLALVCEAEQPFQRSSSGLDELREVVAELKRRKSSQTTRRIGNGLEFAASDRRILMRSNGLPECEMWTLSPSSAEIHRSLQQFAEMLEPGPINAAKTIVRPAAPNNTAVVLWIRVGDRILLLGADLEERRTSPTAPAAMDCGWSAIVSSTGRPASPASVFKVAHHGSLTGHNDDIWSQLLGQDPIAVLTPFRRGRCRLPLDSDKSRILALSAEAYISANSSRRKYKPKDRTVAWAYQGKNPTVPPAMGHVWLRAPTKAEAGTWQVQTLDGACELEQFLAV